MVRCAIKTVVAMVEYGTARTDMRLVSGRVVMKESVRQI